MASPTLNEVHVNRPLSNYMLQYGLQQNYLADKVAPTLPVQFKSDAFYRYPKEYWLQALATLRAPGTPSLGGQYHIDTGSYNCQVYAFHYDLADQIRANADTVIQADMSAVRYVTNNLLNAKELQWHQKFMAPGVWQGLSSTGGDFNVTADGGGAWNTDTSNPVKCIRSLATLMQARTTKRPNTLILTRDVADALMDNRYLLDLVRFSGGEGGFITQSTLQKAFDIQNIYIAETVLNTAQTGMPANTGFLSRNGFLLCFVTPSPSMTEPTAMMTFSWNGYLGGGANGNVIKTFRMEELASDRIEGEMAYDQQVVAPDLGILGTNILAS